MTRDWKGPTRAVHYFPPSLTLGWIKRTSILDPGWKSFFLSADRKSTWRPFSPRQWLTRCKDTCSSLRVQLGCDEEVCTRSESVYNARLVALFSLRFPNLPRLTAIRRYNLGTNWFVQRDNRDHVATWRWHRTLYNERRDARNFEKPREILTTRARNRLRIYGKFQRLILADNYAACNSLARI